MQLVLIGPHGVGKSTLAARLARRLGVAFHAELGREMAEDPSWRPAGTTAEACAAAFDRELFLRELARDAEAGDTPRVIETWHPGNLAYAARRSPAEAACWLAALRESVLARPTVVLPLVARRETLAARQSEPGDLDFFIDVGVGALAWAAQMGLPCLPPLPTDDRDPDALTDLVVGRLGGRLPTPAHTPRS
jgi:DNA polymerase III delta prime subunit